jgi:hypothetical protein
MREALTGDGIMTFGSDRETENRSGSGICFAQDVSRIKSGDNLSWDPTTGEDIVVVDNDVLDIRLLAESMFEIRE